jgi:hypothetical protein
MRQANKLEQFHPDSERQATADVFAMIEIFQNLERRDKIGFTGEVEENKVWKDVK